LPFTCPHGRPIMVKLSISDLEKMFRRKGFWLPVVSLEWTNIENYINA
jgi:hypothetical protein